MTPEGKVVNKIKQAVRIMGGETRKMTWVGHSGAPDLCILFPGLGLHMLVEVKAPGQKPKPHQAREHLKLSDAGFTVWVVDDALDFLWRLCVEYGQYSGLRGALSDLALKAYVELGGKQ